jgi:hypothetical protein
LRFFFLVGGGLRHSFVKQNPATAPTNAGDYAVDGAHARRGGKFSTANPKVYAARGDYLRFFKIILSL